MYKKILYPEIDGNEASAITPLTKSTLIDAIVDLLVSTEKMKIEDFDKYIKYLSENKDEDGYYVDGLMGCIEIDVLERVLKQEKQEEIKKKIVIELIKSIITDYSRLTSLSYLVFPSFIVKFIPNIISYPQAYAVLFNIIEEKISQNDTPPVPYLNLLKLIINEKNGELLSDFLKAQLERLAHLQYLIILNPEILEKIENTFKRYELSDVKSTLDKIVENYLKATNTQTLDSNIVDMFEEGLNNCSSNKDLVVFTRS